MDLLVALGGAILLFIVPIFASVLIHNGNYSKEEYMYGAYTILFIISAVMWLQIIKDHF